MGFFSKTRVFANPAKVPTKKDPKVLGVILDPLLTFKPHAAYIKDKVLSRNNLLKALAGSSWGKEKETLLTTFKATGQSLLNYCAPIWTPTLAPTNWNELQVAQNANIRTALGCVKMSSQDHIHAEAKTMPVKEHCEMLSKQFLLATTLPEHPNQENLSTSPPRLMKHTLTTKFAKDVEPLIPENGTDIPSYKSGLKTLHTLSVQETILNQAPNLVLNEPAPEIHKSERSLSRKARVTLAQLRSGYSSHLNTFLNRINPTKYPDPNCPDCSLAPHTTAHLFNCSTNPTYLTPRSLWTNPTSAALFLGLEDQEGIG